MVLKNDKDNNNNIIIILFHYDGGIWFYNPRGLTDAE